MVTEIPQPLSYTAVLGHVRKFGKKLRVRNIKTNEVCIVGYQTCLNANSLCYFALVNEATHEILNFQDDCDDDYYDLNEHWEFYIEGEV